MKILRLTILAFAALLSLSCGTDVRSLGMSTIELVRSILGNSDSAEYKILKSFDPSVADAAIYVVGDREACAGTAAELVGADDRDNIDGNFVPDRLPDFAGERIATFADISNGPHDSLLIAGKEGLLRENIVRSVLKVVDTLCYLSPFDAEGLGHKSAAKLVVLADPAAAFYGWFDVDSLLKASSCHLPVISPLHTLSREMMCSDNLTIGVLTSPVRVSSGLYPDVFSQAASACGVKDVHCVIYPVANDDDLLLSFLNRYVKEEYVTPLDYLLVDVPGADLEKMTKTLDRVLSVMNEESLIYSACIAPGFKIVETGSVLRRECYRILREKNLFTHRIAMPSEEHYLNIPRSASLDSLQMDIMIEFNSRYISE